MFIFSDYLLLLSQISLEVPENYDQPSDPIEKICHALNSNSQEMDLFPQHPKIQKLVNNINSEKNSKK